MKVVVDTNIVFSAVLNSNSRIGRLLLDASAGFEFYSCKYMQGEIRNHLPKIRRLTRFGDDELLELLLLVESRIFFIDESILPASIVSDARELVEGIDSDDCVFVALACWLDAVLWTGDKVLTDGLRKKGYRKVVNTAELLGSR